MLDLKAKMHQDRFRLPRPLAGFKECLLLKGERNKEEGEREERGRERREGRGEKGNEKGRKERVGYGAPTTDFFRRL